MDIDELPVVGSIATAGAAVGDLLLNGGEIILSLVVFALASPDLWVTALMYADRLADMVAWIPATVVDRLLVIGLVLLVTVTLVRFVSAWRENRGEGS